MKLIVKTMSRNENSYVQLLPEESKENILDESDILPNSQAPIPISR